MVEVKFCGLTRAVDAAKAAELGAAYAGAIFAHGPRLLDAPKAREMFAGLGGAPVRKVGVFASRSPEDVLRIADASGVHVLQLHDGATPDAVLTFRGEFQGEIWVVLKVADGIVEALHDEVIDAADAVVLDTAVGGRSGGTGVAFDWAAAVPAVQAIATRKRVVLAGGLRPGNVSEAVRTLAPSVVDVSSGVESAPGIKDHGLMQAFALAARLREGR